MRSSLLRLQRKTFKGGEQEGGGSHAEIREQSFRMQGAGCSGKSSQNLESADRKRLTFDKAKLLKSGNHVRCPSMF